MAERQYWYGRTGTGSTVGLTAFTTPEFPDGTVVDTSTLPAGTLDDAEELWRAQHDPALGRLVWVDPMSGPPMWYVWLPQAGTDPPLLALVAFATGDLPAGTVVDDDTFAGLGRDNDEQVGAIRWWPDTGQIFELYVQPAMRRKGVSKALLYAASAQQIALGNGKRVWAGGERTDLGEALATALQLGHRIAPRTSVVAPMTPEDKAMGIPARNLYPDAPDTP